MIIDPYAHVRRMNNGIQQTPEPPPAPGTTDATADSHAPAVLRSTALQVGGHLLAICLTAASTIILTRFLGIDGYGRFTVLTVFLLIGVSLSEFGLNGTAVRWFASGERPEEVFASLIGLRLVLSSAAAATAVVVYAVIPTSNAPASALESAGALSTGRNSASPSRVDKGQPGNSRRVAARPVPLQSASSTPHKARAARIRRTP